MSHHKLVERRISYLVAISLVILLAFAVRLIDIQGVRAAGLANKASNELTKKSVIMAPRGAITDINGIEFARSVSAYRILVDQEIVDHPKALAKIAAPILDVDQDWLKEQLIGERRYVVISQSVKPRVWRELEAAVDSYNDEIAEKENGLAKRLMGFFAERIYVREYPEGELGAAVIGFINRAGSGAAGLEYSMNSTLSGIDGHYTYANAAGTIIPGTQKITTEAVRGNTVKLTIDRDVQWVAQEAIRTVVKSSRALSGTVVVMDPATGQVLAHATYPSFTPGDTKDVDPYRWQNPSVQEVYEPGSTGKVMTFAAAVEEGMISPESVMTIPWKLKRSIKYLVIMISIQLRG